MNIVDLVGWFLALAIVLLEALAIASVFESIADWFYE